MKQMKEVKQLFTAKASNFYDTMKCHGGSAGYRIPIYQRMYSWSKDNIERLIVDCLNGFYYLSQEKDRDSGSFTFLGTLILVREKDTEPNFSGNSLSVVDGQQRLTTLVLIACALIEEISIKANEIIPEIDDKRYANWMKEEKDFQLRCLYECVMGTQSSRAETFPYPRIIRDGDSRGLSGTDSEYNSIISEFLQSFSKYYENYYKNNEKCVFKFPTIRDNEKEYEQFKKNHKTIKDKINELSVIYDGDGEDREYEILPRGNFQNAGIRDLFDKVSVCGDEKSQNRAISTVSEEKAFEPLVRLLLFASYFTRYVVLTSVETDDEKAAFDIFDSLNTTGEPLTALETLKPLVIKFEDNKRSGYKGSSSESSFANIKSNLDDKISSDKSRQIETKDAIVSFALYMNGDKLPRDLSRQRTYLRSKYNIISNARKPLFVESMADIAFFKYNYWNVKGIEKLAQFHSTNLDEIQLCMQLISDMRTSLALPILTRYRSKIHGNDGEKNFLDAVKALTGFLILRRAYTGSTSGIDAVFRSLMEKKPSHKGDPLSIGLDREHKIWDISNLKDELRKKLAECMGEISQENWVEKVVENPLAEQSRPLVKFLLFAAADHSIPDPKEKGLWVRDGVKHAAENEYLNYSNWTNSKYGTVEHIAPDSPKNGWDKDIYTQSFRRHTIGNLLLLPEKENKSLGNASWKKKRLFYMAVSGKTTEEAKAWITKSKNEDIEFSRKTEKLILDGDRLQLLDPIRNVESWTADFIQKRSTNIANLAWDTVSSWLLD